MKALLLLALLSIATSNSAHAETDYAPECLSAAKVAVASSAKVSRSKVKLFNAGLLGDGASVVEAIAFKVRGSGGFWIVTMNYDSCTVLQNPTPIHN